MRLSVLPGDPGYRSDAADPSWVVMLDGEPQGRALTGRAIITADEASGTIWFHSYGPDGAPELGAEFGTLAVHQARGKVSIYRILSDYLPRRG